MERTDIRLALPSKGILQEGALDFLEACGLRVFRPNPRQYEATIPGLKGMTVMFQRPGDIVVSVQQGSVDFGITGYDVLAEKGQANSGPLANGNGEVLTLHDELGFGPCTLNLAVPEDTPARTIGELAAWAKKLGKDGRELRIATKFPRLTSHFLDSHGVAPYRLIGVEGTLEIAPAIGYADLIADLVSSGVTLRDNHLRPLDDGLILRSQAVLIANRHALQTRPEVLAIARHLLEYIEAHQRAAGSFLVTANVRGESPQAIAERMFTQTSIGGLQGPTISQVVTPEQVDKRAEGQRSGGAGEQPGWYAVNVVVRKTQLFDAIGELRAIGGSGVIVAPCAYIFEEEPARYRAMLRAIGEIGD